MFNDPVRGLQFDNWKEFVVYIIKGIFWLVIIYGIAYVIISILGMIINSWAFNWML